MFALVLRIDYPDNKHITGLTLFLVFQKHHCNEYLHKCRHMGLSQLVRGLFSGAGFLGYEMCTCLIVLHTAIFLPEQLFWLYFTLQRMKDAFIPTSLPTVDMIWLSNFCPSVAYKVISQCCFNLCFSDYWDWVFLLFIKQQDLLFFLFISISYFSYFFIANLQWSSLTPDNNLLLIMDIQISISTINMSICPALNRNLWFLYHQIHQY